MSSRIDLNRYLDRIGYSGDPQPAAAGLQALHLAHASQIPFENLDVLRGVPIRLDLASLQAKLIGARRGGYCFEQNLLFAAALEALGFGVTPLAARVRWRTSRRLPRTHMLLLVEADGERWLADVGFGGHGLLQPLMLRADEPQQHYAWRYRLLSHDDGWLLQTGAGGDWEDLYAFTLQPQCLADYEMANYYVSHHPQSRFTQTLTVQRPTPRVRYLLVNGELSADYGDRVERRVLADVAELRQVLAELFKLPWPDDASLPAVI